MFIGPAKTCFSLLHWCGDANRKSLDSKPSPVFFASCGLQARRQDECDAGAAPMTMFAKLLKTGQPLLP
jgi:hypothetical protein